MADAKADLEASDKEKIICSVCGTYVGFSKFPLADGWLCAQCRKQCAYPFDMNTKSKSAADARADWEKVASDKTMLANFVTTKKVGTFIEFDETQRKWLVPDGPLGKKVKPQIYAFEDIVEFELLEDGDSVTRGGLGRALVGGVLFGGIGAIVGGSTGGRTTKSVINSLKLKITINNFARPVVYVNLSRNLLDMLQLVELCEQHKTAYVCAGLNFNTGTPIGCMVLQILAAFAEFERSMIATRVRTTVMDIAEKTGRYQTVPPFGYMLDEHKNLVVVPDQAEWVRQAADMFIAGHGYRAVAKHLNDDGIIASRALRAPQPLYAVC